MSQTTANQSKPTVTSTFNFQPYQMYAYQFQEQTITIGLLGGLYGILTILSVTSVYALTRRRRNIRPVAITLSITILALFTSTTLYVVISILQCQSYFLRSFLGSPTSSVWSYSPPIVLSYQSERAAVTQDGLNFIKPSLAKQCASAATLTVNVVLGDAIVCWRACVIWYHNRVVRAVCGFSLLATLGLGAFNATQSCLYTYSATARNTGPGPVIRPGTLFEGLPLGIAACVLSLSTNILTTLLVAYKAWESRKRFREYLVAKVGGSRVEKLLALLIESGAIYSAIWAVVVAYQVGEFEFEFLSVFPANPFGPKTAVGPESATESKFLDIFGVIMDGALVPVIAIYPAIIIVLVALDSSHMERGLTQHLESLPTPCIAHTINTTATSLHESRLHRRSEVLVIGEQSQESRCGDVSDESESEDVSGCTSEERKGQEIA